MYIPPAFREDDRETQYAMIEARPLGLLVASGEDGPVFTHVPFLLDRAVGDRGVVRAHVAKANGIWRAVEANPEVSVVFDGPDAYISPDWYEDRLQVPTWNFSAVYLRGRARIMESEETFRQIVALSDREEEKLRPKSPWRIEKVPAQKIEMMRRAIVGIEVEITAIDAKVKMSQNKDAADRTGVAQALRALGGDDHLAVADLVAGDRHD